MADYLSDDRGSPILGEGMLGNFSFAPSSSAEQWPNLRGVSSSSLLFSIKPFEITYIELHSLRASRWFG